MYNEYNRDYPKKERNEVIRKPLDKKHAKEDNSGCLYDVKLKGPWRASQKLNFRSDSSMSASIIRVLEPSDRLICDGYYKTDEDGNEWIKSNFNGFYGFVMKTYLTR